MDSSVKFLIYLLNEKRLPITTIIIIRVFPHNLKKYIYQKPMM